MAIYRGPGGSGDATQDAASEVLLAVQAKNDAIAAKEAAEAAKTAAELAETNAETAETNAETAETNAETAQTAAEAAQAAAEAVLTDPDFVTVVGIEADITTVAGIAADVTTVAGISADVTTVAGIDQTDLADVAAIDTDVTTVAGIATNVTSVAGIASDVTTVATNNANVTTVATDIANVNAVGSNIANVNAVAANETNINAVEANETNINTVAGISANVTTVAGISANVTTVAGISANVTTVAGINADVTTVAGIDTEVTTVAGIAANVTSVAGNATNINTVATDIANVNAVGSNITNVNTVAGNSANINTVAGISANVTTVAGISSNVTTVATNNANVTTVATNIASVNTNATNIANINQNAANIVAIQNASTNATNAANSATAAATSATNAAASAAAASAVALGNEPVRHSVRPSLLLDFANTRTLDPRITFTRGSTGTFYDGRTVVKAEENLLLQSQDFTTTWTNVNSSDTSNTTIAPDGTTTADTITATGTGAHYVQQTSLSTTGTQRVLSCFVKAGTNNYVQLGFGTSVTAYANFNVTSGAGDVGTVGATATASIVDAGGGWYRCIVITSDATASALCFVAIIQSSTDTRLVSFSAAGTETILVWGAQVEQRSSVTAYTATTTAPITNYIPALQTAAANVARFEHNPVTGESLGLLIEEQRTNQVTHSAAFDNVAWTRTRTNVSVNSIVSPDGTLGGTKLTENTETNTHLIGDGVVTTAAAHTFSFYAKAAERGFVRAGLYDGASFYLAYFNLTAGSVGTLFGTGTSASITAVGNGWYRCAVTATTAASSSSQVQIRMASANGTDNYAGDGYSGIYIWGAQLEAGAFATSYIPTVAASATRSADAASMTGTNFSSWYRADEGTLYGDVVFNFVPSASQFPALLSISDGTAGESHQMYFTSTSAPSYEIRDNGTQQAVINRTDSNPNKFVGSYKVNDIAFVVDAGTIGTDSSATLPTVDRCFIGASASGANYTNGTIKKLAFYPRRLTNSELQGLTTV